MFTVGPHASPDVGLGDLPLLPRHSLGIHFDAALDCAKGVRQQHHYALNDATSVFKQHCSGVQCMEPSSEIVSAFKTELIYLTYWSVAIDGLFLFDDVVIVGVPCPSLNCTSL